MTISFDNIPTDRRTPDVNTEFDNTQAIRGTPGQPFKILHIGQRLSTGLVAAEVLTQITREEQAAEAFGEGSMLHRQIAAAFGVDKTTETWAIALADDAGGVAASGQFVVSGTAAESGTAYFYVGGQRFKVAVTSGDTASTVATALRAAINAEDDRPIVVGGSSGTVDVAARNKGAEGNGIDLRHSYYTGEEIPSGLSVAVTAMASGSGNPDVQDAIDVMGDTWFNIVIHPYLDTANLNALRDELETRWGPLVQKDGHAVTFANKDFAALATLGNTHNSKQLTIFGCPKVPSLPWEVAGAAGAIFAFYAPSDPARPLQNLTLTGILPPAAGERLTQDERNLLLYDGIATLKFDADGSVLIEREITTYKTNSFGADDASYLDYNPKATLGRIRYDWNNYMRRKYPRHKLANDGTRFGAGQAIITPKQAKAEMILKFTEWEENGWVEGFTQFKKDLIAERNIADVNRLDLNAFPDLVNQLRILGTKISFLL